MITETETTFKSMEESIYKMVCAAGCNCMKSILEDMDAHIVKERDREIYRHKGKRATAVKTLMGEVEYERTVYKVEDGHPGKKHVYLLDEMLKRETVGLISSALAERIIESCCEMPYRKAAGAVSNMTGQTISHAAAWNVVQAVGERIRQQEKEAAGRAKKGTGRGTYESKILFEEQDGIWLRLQGKDRKKYGSSKEMKLMIAYSGAKKTGKQRYELQNKVACCSFSEAEKFYELKEGVIADYYASDEIETRILNGDGASWIRRSAEGEDTHFQLDTYHRNKAVIAKVQHPKARREIMRLLYEKKADSALEYISILADSVPNEGEQKKLQELYQYLSSNADGLVGYHRRGLSLPTPPEGVVYRRLGAMESNVFSLIGRRMKGRRTVWSIQGGNNLGRLLCLGATKQLKAVLQKVIGCALPERYAEEITKPMKASDVEDSVGKGYNGFHKVIIPTDSCFKWMKGLMSSRPFYDITYR